MQGGGKAGLMGALGEVSPGHPGPTPPYCCPDSWPRRRGQLGLPSTPSLLPVPRPFLSTSLGPPSKGPSQLPRVPAFADPASLLLPTSPCPRCPAVQGTQGTLAGIYPWGSPDSSRTLTQSSEAWDPHVCPSLHPEHFISPRNT